MDLTPAQKNFTLVGVLLALFLGALDQTIVATALPRIVQDLRGLDRYTWVATPYLLATTIMVPIYGKLADTLNRKSVELAAASLFLAGSFLCGLSGAVPFLSFLGGLDLNRRYGELTSRQKGFYHPAAAPRTRTLMNY